MNSFSERLKQFLNQVEQTPQLILAVAGILVGSIGVATSGFLYFQSASTGKRSTDYSQITSQEDQKNSEPKVASASSVPDQVVVDVSGAVKKPGIYTLSSNQRIYNALEMAGGLSKDADLGFIYKQINLADKVTEGQKIYFPPIQTDTDSLRASNSQITGQSSLISINNASAEELDSLPGIGEKLATKIIDGRPYQNVEELTSRVKIGDSVFSKIESLIKL